MVTSAEALELLEGPPACLYRGSRPHGPSRSGLGEFQVEEALRPHLGLGDGFPGEAGAEREEGLLSSGPASARSPVPRPAQPTMASQSVGRACAGLAQPPFLPRRLWLGVGEATGSTPAQTPLSLQGPAPSQAARGRHLAAGLLLPLGGPFTQDGPAMLSALLSPSLSLVCLSSYSG